MVSLFRFSRIFPLQIRRIMKNFKLFQDPTLNGIIDLYAVQKD
jgi:hypothetical protein